MKIGYFVNSALPGSGNRSNEVLEQFSRHRVELYDISAGLQPATDMLLSFGGDGTFLSAARNCAQEGVPILGINCGRMGFLADARPEFVVDSIVGGNYNVEQCDILAVQSDSLPSALWPYAINEVAFNRNGANMIGIDVRLDGYPLPTYWADGLLVSTSAGSTAYSLSAGGPICAPSLRAFLIVPVAPHNLNVRPLVVPSGSVIELEPHDSSDKVLFSIDNQSVMLSKGTGVKLAVAPFKLRRVRLSNLGFFGALQEKLFWGQDIRNK